MVDADRLEDFVAEHLPEIGLRTAYRLQESIDRQAQQEVILVAVPHDGTRLPRVGLEVTVDERELLGGRAGRVPSVVLAVEIPGESVVRFRLEAAEATETARHIGGVDETDPAPLRMQAGHMVTDPQVEHIGPVGLGEAKQRERCRDALHHRAHAEPHLERIGVGTLWRARCLVVERAAVDDRVDHLPLGPQRSTEGRERARRELLLEFRPRSRGQAVREFASCGGTLRLEVGRSARREGRRGASPEDDMLV